MKRNTDSLMRGVLSAATLALAFSSTCAYAQDAVPVEMLTRTVMLRAGNEAGTAFAIARGGELYFVTARHLVKPTTPPGLQVWQDRRWKPLPVLRIIWPRDPRADIAVIDTGHKAPSTFTVKVASGAEGPTLGQQMWFLGYPFANMHLATHAFGRVLPFIKRATFSAIDASDPGAPIVYLDGFNNPGFSGGPVLYWDFKAHAYRIFAVVRGYMPEQAATEIHGAEVPVPVLVNSGIMVACTIGPALKAIAGVAATAAVEGERK